MTTITDQLAESLRRARRDISDAIAVLPAGRNRERARAENGRKMIDEALAAYDAQPKAFTVFIRDLAGTGTTFITSVVGDVEEAKRAAIAECLAEWELPDTPTGRDSLHVLGVAPGDINFIEWTDLES